MNQSQRLFSEAQKYIPGGVNSPVRAFSSVEGEPLYIKRGLGSKIYSEEDQEYTDYCGSWGPLILGHCDPDVLRAIEESASRGLSFGTCCAPEVTMAKFLCENCSSIEKVRMVNSGTEATMTALRLARGYTKKEGIIKFAGCYHGHHDAMLIAAGSGLLTQGTPSSKGVTKGAIQDISILPYKDLEALRIFMEEKGDQIAGIILEPLAGNMGLIDPGLEFLQGLRDICDQYKVLLIFDEVISGFRQGPTTWGDLIGIKPDLTCLGKIIGGGMPIGAIGGRVDIMDLLAPLGPVYQAGTLSGNPVALSAGYATLSKLKKENPYPHMKSLGDHFALTINSFAQGMNLDFHIAHLGGMFTPFFTKNPVASLKEASLCDTKAYAKFHSFMLKKGVYLPPSQFETAFFNATHTKEDCEYLIDSVKEYFTI